MTRIALALVALVATGCISPPFIGPATVGHDAAHHGWPSVDFRLARGTPLLAVADSRVIMVGYEAPGDGDPVGCPESTAYCGRPDRFVVIRLGRADNGCRRIAYKHLDTVAVEHGDWLAEGDVIGTSGNEVVRRPHLHFDCQPDDTSRYNHKPPGLDYPWIESCVRGRWSLHGSDTFERRSGDVRAVPVSDRRLVKVDDWTYNVMVGDDRAGIVRGSSPGGVWQWSWWRCADEVESFRTWPTHADAARYMVDGCEHCGELPGAHPAGCPNDDRVR